MSTSSFPVHVRLFGVHRESAGAPVVEVELAPGSTVRDLRSALARHPAMARPLGRVAVAVNRRYASEEEVIAGGDEIALIPPVAGG